MKIFLLSSVLITMFLGFIDEGYYNFRWMNNIGNWIALSVYAMAIFLGQLLIFKGILIKYNGRGKILLSLLLGALVGIWLVAGIVFG